MFRTINWSQRADDNCFTQYRSCVFSNRNAQGGAELRVEMDLSLEELREQGQGRDIFHLHAFFSLRSAQLRVPESRWDIFCLGDLFATSIRRPRNR